MLRNSKIRWGLKALLVASLFLVVGCGSISGTVSSGGEPLAGVTVELKGDVSTSTKTDACGNYRFPWVAKGTYSIIPSLTGYRFTPENRSVAVDKGKHITGVNFDGSSGSAVYSISGTVTSGTATLSGVTVSLAGVAAASTTTDASGRYQFTDLPGGDYAVTPSSIPGYGFNPADVTLNADTTLDFQAIPNTARSWGRNILGQLGNNQNLDSPSPVQVSNLSRVVVVTAGVSHSLALLDDGTVWAWGQGTSGQLGNSLFANSSVPVAVSATWGSTRRAVAIAAGGNHSLALLDDGTVWAWGLGVVVSPDTAINFPVQISATWGTTRRAVAITSGIYHSMARLDDGTVWAWGVGSSGQLGNGLLQDSLVPVPISATWDPTRRAVAIAAGGYHSLALLDDGTVWTWGENSDGRLGWDTAGWPSAIPGQVVDARGNAINNVASIAGGEYHSIAVTTTRQVLAWGLNDDGQLGVNTSATPSSIIPVDVPRLTGVVAIAAGSSHSVASTSDGTVWTWGNNLFGQLGNGSTGSYEYTPAAVPGLINIMNIAAGSYHTIAVKSPGVDP